MGVFNTDESSPGFVTGRGNVRSHGAFIAKAISRGALVGAKSRRLFTDYRVPAFRNGISLCYVGQLNEDGRRP